jgi:hypothetical protein
MEVENSTVDYYEELLQSWFWSSRREALIFGSLAIAFPFSTLELALADAEFQIEVPRQNEAVTGTPNEKDHPLRTDREEIGNQTGIEYRPPTCGMQDLTTMQFLGTRTPESAPGYLSVSPNSYFADDLSRSFFSNGETCLSTASRKIGGGERYRDRYHLFNRPTALPPGESVEQNFKRLVPSAGSVSAVATRDAQELMRNRGKWDYKRRGREWEDAGNFNYGFISAALDIPEWFALRYAGWYGTHHGAHDESQGHWYDLSGSFGDDPRDQAQIRQGYEYFYDKDLIDLIYGLGKYDQITQSFPAGRPD